MIHALRIVKARYAKTAFSGEGARRAGGRWNSPGHAMVYLAGSTSLAILEMLVHLGSEELVESYVLFEAVFDDSLVRFLDPETLPAAWREQPAPLEVKAVGDKWIASAESAVLRVPSAIVPAEWNYLLNPNHADFSKIEISREQPIRFDPRLRGHKN